jgi:peptide/nickel transport system substrate-binding protein
MLVAGTVLLAAAGSAGAGGEAKAPKRGGIFRMGLEFGSPAVDPQISYSTIGWALEYATAAKLYNYPDKAGLAGSKLMPEVASKFTVSNNGKRYTFTIRKGFRFSDGKPVTAKNFKYAIERAVNHDLPSAGAAFVTDPNATNIVGAAKANSGATNKVSGVVAKRNKLIISLTRADGTFMAKITMPFFQATSTRLPLTKVVTKVHGIGSIPSAGPYAFSRNEIDRVISIRQNRFWKPGPGRDRPRNLAGVNVFLRQNEDTAFNLTMANELDMALPPAAAIGGLRKRFGKNTSRYWVKPQTCTWYLALNTARPLFGNVKLRRAVNYAVSREDYVDLAGLDAGSPWSHLFGPGTPGLRPAPLYQSKPDLARAHKLAPKASLRDKKV